MKDVIPISGQWSCRLDPESRGRAESWQLGTVADCVVNLPGTTHTNGIGRPPAVRQIGNLTPVTDHVGPAWYWRDVELTEAQCREVVELHLERCCWETHVWVNGEAMGTRDSLVSPHVYDLSRACRPGTNRLVVMVDNANLKRKTGDASTAMTEDEELMMEANASQRLACGGHHTLFLGFTWNGITGKMEIRVRPRVRMTSPKVRIQSMSARVAIRCTGINELDTPVPARLAIEVCGLWDDARGHYADLETVLSPGSTDITLEVDLGQTLRLWDEHAPNLYRLRASLHTERGVDAHETEFGLRQLSAVGRQLAINGRPTFLRGYLEKFVHPLTFHPPTDLEYWVRILSVSRAHGFNHVRFHSCCPPEAAFAAADRLGMIFNIELPGCSGEEPDDRATTDYLQAEALRILDTFSNHPSFCMLTMGNEILVDERAERSQRSLVDRVAKCREFDPDRWYCCTAHAYTPGRDDDFYVTAWPNGPTAKDRHQGEPLRGFRWNGGDVIDDSRFNTRPPETTSDYRDGIAGIDKPLITHEVGMWAVYPDVREIDRYVGVCKPHNLELIRDFMSARGTLDLADRFVRASGELSLLLYKEEIEAAMRTPGLAGFQLLGLHDHPPQGTSTIGIITALREPKGIISPEAFRRFCSETVPLARLAKRVFARDEPFVAHIDLAHHGPIDLPATSFLWRLETQTGVVHAQGQLEPQRIRTGSLTRLGAIDVSLSSVHAPAKLILRVTTADGRIANHWDVWVYDSGPDPAKPEGAIWSNRWTPDLAQSIHAGAAAVLELGTPEIPGAIRASFTTLLWNPIMKRRHLSQTMGVLCDPSHRALAAFPTESHTNWQWWDVLRPSRVLDISNMPSRPEPIVRLVDSFIGNRHLAVVLEARLGRGRILITSLDLSSDLSTRHAASQLRKSLTAYVASDAFAPEVAIEAADIDALLRSHQTAPAVLTRGQITDMFERA